MSEVRQADEWWHSLPDDRRASIHRWVSARPTPPPDEHQVSIFDLMRTLTPRGVAEHNKARTRTGKVHRVRREPTATRNRSQYRTVCGLTVRYGLPVDSVHDDGLCGHCYPPGREETA